MFVYTDLTSFVAADLRILQQRFRVIPYRYEIKTGAGRRFGRFLWSNRREYGLIFVWFGDIYATLAVSAARLLGKKVVIVSGGYDTTYIPSIDYGLLGSEKKRKRARRAFHGADRVLVVDKSLQDELQRNLLIDGSNLEVVHTGYDPTVFAPSGPKTERRVLTVSTVDGHSLRRKGLKTFIEAAQEIPEFSFHLAGPWRDSCTLQRLREMSPSNVSILGELSQHKLIQEYQRAKVYAQLSIFEGLPNALAEAMLCECVPVGTRVCGIPTLIGDCGFYVVQEDPAGAARAIEEAARTDLGSAARDRIARLFPLRAREDALARIIKEVAGG